MLPEPDRTQDIQKISIFILITITFLISLIVTISHGVSIKMDASDLVFRLGFKKNETLRVPTAIASPFMANMERYAFFYVYTDII